MAYIGQEGKAKIAPLVKAALKKYGLKGSLSIQHHSKIVLKIKSGKIDFISNFNKVAAAKGARTESTYIDVNEFHFQNQYTGKAKQALEEIYTALKSNGWFDKSDIMTDYFHVAYYIDVCIGTWDKPYIVTK